MNALVKARRSCGPRWKIALRNGWLVALFVPRSLPSKALRAGRLLLGNARGTIDVDTQHIEYLFCPIFVPENEALMFAVCCFAQGSICAVAVRPLGILA